MPVERVIWVGFVRAVGFGSVLWSLQFDGQPFSKGKIEIRKSPFVQCAKSRDLFCNLTSTLTVLAHLYALRIITVIPFFILCQMAWHSFLTAVLLIALAASSRSHHKLCSGSVYQYRSYTLSPYCHSFGICMAPYA